MLKSQCYACENYDWAIVVPTQIIKYAWEHICKIDLSPGDDVHDCPGFTQPASAGFLLPKKRVNDE